MIGQELGGRYQIIDRIGGGGMAVVYKGHDLLLHRKVAIKVLRQQYVHDEEFIRRFRREAQSAASLSHSNVVSIYDVGQEDEIHYIVMEYVEGQTLNELIKEKAPLQVEQAINIASQICDALDHAHQNQIIHRDIKPHNILIGKNGRVKVTDFGIARAADSSQITQTGSVVGSVHYFSPEHAKGVSTGAKSDLYSLGIVLYQMLTGRLPFHGESPISVALKHLQEDVEEPRKVNPMIPQSVENIILKAMRKKPEERYQSAKKMLQDLETCLTPEKRNEPKIMFFDDDEQTRVLPAIRAGRYTGRNQVEPEEADHAKKSSWLKPTLWSAFALILLLAMWYGVAYVKSLFYVPEVEVPNVTQISVQEAENRLRQVKLVPNVITQYKDDVSKDIVFEQKPSGMKVKENSTVNLYVSLGVEKQAMPDFVGKNMKDVQLELSSLGINENQIFVEEVFIDEPVGKVIKQTPAANEQYDPKSLALKLTVSKGRETFEMPDLIGLSEAEAKSRITFNNLKLAPDGVIRQPTYKQPKGKVFEQWPFDPKASVSKGQEVKIYVSTGLPEEAGELKVLMPIKPAMEGQPSKIKIMVSDPRYDNFEYTTKTISKVDVIEVKVVVAPNKNAVIRVYRDDQLVDSKTVTYKDYQSQNPRPASAKPVDSTSGSSSGGGGSGAKTSTGSTQTGTGTGTGTINAPAPTGSSGAGGRN